MIKIVNRYFFTIIHINLIQLIYQIWYRLKRRWLNINKYNCYVNNSLKFLNFQLTRDLIISENKYLGQNRFSFIGIYHDFKNKIDWNYDLEGKLWNYNLQYFDFLLDNSIGLSERIRLLKDFNFLIMSGGIEPEPYPVSLRLLNTLIFISENKINEVEIFIGIKKQFDFLDNNLEYHLLANHLLENFISGYIISCSIESEKLKKRYKKLLKKELDIQILKDGGHYECSPMYHSIILSKLLITLEVARLEDDSFFILFLENKIQLMAGWILQFSFPDGTWALMNDAAEKIAPKTEHLLKVLTSMGISPKFELLNDSGYKKIIEEDWECVIKTGNIRPSYQPGHTHSDMLSFCLWHKKYGQIIVDPGISTYDNTLQRQKERSTLSHNTVSIGMQNQSDVWGSFRIGKRGFCNVIEDSEGNFIAEVYSQSNSKVHLRKFIYSKKFLEISDELKGKGLLSFTSSILFSNNFNFTFNCGDIDSTFLKISTIPQGEIKEDYYAKNFNDLIKTSRLSITSENQKFIKFIFK